MKNVVVTGCQFQISVGGAVIGSGVVTPTSTPDLKIICNNKNIYDSPLAISVSGYTDSAIANGMGNGTIVTSAVKTNKVILEGDSGNVVLSGVNPQTGAPVSGYTVNVKITSAGQSKVVAA